MSNKHIYIKINTVPATEDRNSKEFELFYDKYKEAKTLGNYEEAYEQFLLDSHKHYLFGKIYSITVSSVHEDKIVVKVIKGDERDVLQHFYNLYTEEFFKGAKSVIWRGEFVLPFLSMRAIKNKVTHSGNDLSHFGKRAWGLSCLDLYEYLTGAGYFVPSLEEIAFVFNLETDFINNADTYKLIKSGQENVVDEAAINEIKTLINIHRQLQQQEVIEEVVSQVYTVENVEVKELPILERLYNDKNFEAIKEDLEKLIKKKKPTKKDKENLEKIITSHAIQTIDVMDFDEVKKQKEAFNEKIKEEIKNFINTL